ncbi:hypothetical protein K470DRAFT_272993 [Piedraia hortae CBS 480.64]|uniref:Uncharacterized protein n=1 Tax=Piedraia hortae CBS 480.64 TaxID=1314780 RepID=A0A6A7BRD5_9PEZI|nr:hypothetical protein K470DRAFT_272993 [Piedraia hortae CBS 480.64]
MAQDGAANNQGYIGVNNGALPPAGHHSDMQLMLRRMEELSDQLQQNREQWAELQNGISRVEGNGGMTFRDNLQPEEPSLAHLSTCNCSFDHETYRKALQQYEEALGEIGQRIRKYCFDQQNHMIAMQQHYSTLLTQSRRETMEAQLIQQTWQASLQRMSERLRTAFAAHEEQRRPWLGKIQALKAENYTLRKLAGLDPVSDSEGEDENKEEEKDRVVNSQGIHDARSEDAGPEDQPTATEHK